MACFQLGAVAFIVNTNAPLDRQIKTIRMSGCKLLLTNSESPLLNKLSDVRCLSDCKWRYDHTNKMKNIKIEDLPDPDSAAYLLFTSGSTGEPKGVVCTHRMLDNLINWQLASHTINDDPIFHYSSTGFDVSVQEIAYAFASGRPLVIVNEDIRSDPEALISLCEQNKVNEIFIPFSALKQIIPKLNKLGDKSFMPHVITQCGEALQISSEFISIANNYKMELRNQYGPTETHVVSEYVLPKNPNEWEFLPPIGFPIWNTQLYILDQNLEPVQAGVVGELYIAGECLGRGYHGRGDLTAERFIANPFAYGARMFRSGDLVIRRLNGVIDYLGRVDDQVKIRGYRVEPSEVEAQSLNLFDKEIEQIAVVPRKVNGLNLVAYVVPRPGIALPKEHQYRKALNKILPDYMVPIAMIELEKLPLNINGKLDSRILPNPDIQVDQFVEPIREYEIFICEIFKDLTGLDIVGATDNFFTIGGDSIKVMSLVRQIKQQYSFTIEPREIFINSTPREISDLLLESRTATVSSAFPLNNSKDDRVIIAIHPGGGFSSVYRSLVKTMPQFNWQGFDADLSKNGSYRFKTLTDIARRYVDETINLFPNKKIIILGWSFGGNIAQEMSVLFNNKGFEHRGVILLDSVSSSPQDSKDLSRNEMLANLAGMVNMDTNDANELNQSWLADLCQNLGKASLIQANINVKDFLASLDRSNEAVKMMRLHKQRPHRKPTLLIKAMKDKTAPEYYSNWQKVSDGKLTISEHNLSHGGLCHEDTIHLLNKSILDFLSNITDFKK